MASSHAPVAEPPRTSAPSMPVMPSPEIPSGVPKRLSPQEAEKVARQVKQARVERARRLPATRDGKEPVSIPALPPVPHAPARLTPIVSVTVQMLLDVVAMAGAFVVAYRLRFEEDHIEVAGGAVMEERPGVDYSSAYGIISVKEQPGVANEVEACAVVETINVCRPHFVDVFRQRGGA